jgi:hypothetical protein
MGSKLRLAVPLLAVVALMTLGATASIAADKVTICHKNGTIVVNENAVAMHLAKHGDYLGACVVPPAGDEGGGTQPPAGGDETGTPGGDAETPGDDAQSPGDDAETPADDAQSPGDDAETPADDAQSPADEAEANQDEGQGAGSETQAPEEGDQDTGSGPKDDPAPPSFVIPTDSSWTPSESRSLYCSTKGAVDRGNGERPGIALNLTESQGALLVAQGLVTPAFFYAGFGATCEVLPGFVYAGYWVDNVGDVVPGVAVYPYYIPKAG